MTRTIDIKGQPVEFSATMRRDQPDGISGGTNYWIDFAWDNGGVSFAEILDAVWMPSALCCTVKTSLAWCKSGLCSG